jgi:hypothetical protein
MGDAAARAIVRKALDLVQRQPDSSALEILDLAMEGHLGSAPDFSSADEAPEEGAAQQRFGELLRRAFAPRNGTAGQERWQREVLERFAQRYHLWQH